jgi:hypothetical protein
MLNPATVKEVDPELPNADISPDGKVGRKICRKISGKICIM